MSIQSNFPAISPSLLLDFASTKQLDNRVTFTRSTPAVYYDGKTTAMAEQNLILQSQTFETTWIASQSSITANSTTAPDGTSTADTLTDNTASGTYHFLYQTAPFVFGTTYVLSCYAKNNNGQYLGLSAQNDLASFAGATFDLVNGTFNSGQAGTGWFASASMVSVGSGWYRCIVAITSGITISAASIQIYRSNSPNAPSNYGMYFYTGTGQSVYIWGAQLEQRATATAYTPTTTQSITNYIPVLLSAGGNQPRFDCNPTTGESLGLLIEEQRTNLATYSAQFDNAAWSKYLATVAANTMVAPDGTLSADILLPDSTSSDLHQFEQSFSFSAIPYTASIYVKPYGYSYCMFGIGGATSKGKYYDLVNGTVGADWASAGATGTITSVGNGWFKITMTVTASAGSGGLIVRVYNSNTFGAFSGNGISGLLTWGAQLEAGAFATSYIATTSASATRTADAASMTGTNFSSWYNADEGSWYSEAATSSTTGNGRIFSVSSLAGASDPIYSINFESNGQTRIYQVVSGSATYDFRPSNYSANTFVKLSGGYKLADYAGVANNSTISTSTSQVRLPMLTYLQIGALTNGSSFFLNGTIKKIAYYPIKVTNAQLQALTS